MLKQLAKWILRATSIIVITPLIGTHCILSLFGNKDHSLESHSQLLSLIPGKTGNYLRVAFYRFALEHCDPTATICFGTLLSKSATVIKSHVYIGPCCMVGLVTIEQDVLIGPSVQIPSGGKSHKFDQPDLPIRLQGGELKRVTIGQDSWIGANSIILADVAPKNVIGASSTVVTATKPKSVNAGNPSQFIRYRYTSEEDQTAELSSLS